MDALPLFVAVLAASQLVLFLLLLAFARQLGLILVRLGPTSARPTSDGLSIGTLAGSVALTDIAGRPNEIVPTKYERKLLSFVSSGCSACAELLPALRTVARQYRDVLRVYAISSSDHTAKDFEFAKRLGASVVYACDRALHQRFAIHTTPYAVLLDVDNKVVAKGIANNLEHLESLIASEAFRAGADAVEGLAAPVSEAERPEVHL